MPITLIASFTPSAAPWHIASRPLAVSRSIFACAPPRVGLRSVSGRRIFAITSAAGALITDAVSRCPASMPMPT
jgi:hypothetical protein